MLRRSKDAAIEWSARVFLNRQLRGIGEVAKIDIDTARGRVHATLVLRGERAPVALELRYRINANRTRPTITISKASASRTWMNAALRRFVCGEKFVVPTAARPFIALVQPKKCAA